MEARMEFNSNTYLKGNTKTKSMDNVLENHFENIEQGIFDSNNFCADLQTIPEGDVDYKKCVQSMLKLTKDRMTGTANYKIVNNLEKMMEVLLENYTEKKAGTCEVLFFPSKENEEKIIEYLENAKEAIDVCMFVISNERLCQALLEAHLRGVIIRLITDDEEVKYFGAHVRDLSEEGIQIRTDSSKNALMHNKFVIIDKKILMTGSYNWTNRATKVNQENVVIIENPYLVDNFSNEFNKLWKLFTPQGFKALEGKYRKKTKLYAKLQSALKKKELLNQEVLGLVDDDDEEQRFKINPRSKKISKASKVRADLDEINSSIYCEEDEEEAENEMQMEKPSRGVKFARSFFKISMTVVYVFSLVLFGKMNGDGGAIGGMEIEPGLL